MHTFSTRLPNFYVIVYHITINTDINECIEQSDQCSENCTNTIGSYDCTCNDGYELDSDGRFCIGM